MTVLLAATLSIGKAGADTGCSSPAGPAACLGSSSAPLVSPDQARQAALALWDAQERGHVTRNAALLDQIDTGTELLEANYALDSLKCGCSQFYWTKGKRSASNITVYVPRQSHYPLYFMAKVLAAPKGQVAPAGEATAQVIVTRSAPDQPWKLASEVFDTGYDTQDTGDPDPTVDSQGYEQPVPPELTREARGWPSELAAYYLHLKDFGAPPTTSRFLPGVATTGTDLTLNRQGAESGGVIHHYRFVASALGGPWVFGVYQVEVCADINEYDTMVWATPHTVFQQIDGTRPNWGADLDTGFYSKIVTTWQREVCIVPSGGKLEAVGTDSPSGYPIHTGGVPATPGPGWTRVL